MNRALATAGACLLGGAVSLLVFHAGVTYDPAAWIVWAAELPHRKIGMGVGPSWKPLPVFVASPFTLFSWQTAEFAWLLLVRTSAIATSVLLWRIASRIVSQVPAAGDGPDPAANTVAERSAGLVAAALPWLVPSWTWFALCGASEPVLMALLLLAIEAHLLGRFKVALLLGVAAGLIRPEVWVFLAIYGIWLIYRQRRRALPVVLLGAAIELFGWFAVPWLAGSEPFQATNHARVYTERVVSLGAFASRTAGELPVGGWLLIGFGLLATLMIGNRLLSVVTISGLGWLVCVTILSQLGYSGIARYADPALVILSIPAGVGVGWTVIRAGRFQTLAVVGFLAVLIASFAMQWHAIVVKAKAVDDIGRLGRQSKVALDAAGGARVLVGRCGPLATTWAYPTVISLRNHLSLGNVYVRPEAPAILIINSNQSTDSQPVPPLGTTGIRELGSAGPWKVIRVTGTVACPGD